MFTVNQPRVMIRFSIFTLFFLTSLVAFGHGNADNTLSSTHNTALDSGEEESNPSIAAALEAMMTDPVGRMVLKVYGDISGSVIGKLTPDDSDPTHFFFDGRFACPNFFAGSAQVPVHGYVYITRPEATPESVRVEIVINGMSADGDAVSIEFRGRGRQVTDDRIRGRGKAQGEVKMGDDLIEFSDVPAGFFLSGIDTPA